MVTHGNKQIKKQLPTLLHLHLHRPTALKRRPATYNQRQVVRTQPGFSIGRVRVSISRAGQDRVALDACVEALFAQGKTF